MKRGITILLITYSLVSLAQVEYGGEPLSKRYSKATGMYVAGKETACYKGPSYYYPLANATTILSYLRTGSETNTATIRSNYCKPSLVLAGAKNNSETYSVKTSITSTQAISDGHTVRYQAGTYVELNNGFVSGTDFVAEINPCVVVTTIIAAKTDDEIVETKFGNISSSNWLKVYPIILSSGNAITIEASVPVNGVELMMFDIQGKHIQSFQLNNFIENSKVSVLTPDLPSGLYVLKANDGTHSFTQKIVLQ